MHESHTRWRKSGVHGLTRMQSPGSSYCKNETPPATVSRDRKGPLRVLHVFGALTRGGAETWLMDVVHSHLHYFTGLILRSAARVARHTDH